MTSSREGDILEAVAYTLLDAGVTPSTTLVSLALDGDGHPTGVNIPVDDLEKFRATEVVIWYDMLGEEPLPIAEDWEPESGNPIPLNFAGLEYSWLQKAHQPGARLAVHLYDTTPPVAAFSLALDDPVVWVDVRTETGVYVAVPATVEPTLSINVEYRLQLTQARSVGQDGALMNPVTWVKRVRERAHGDMQTLMDALIVNDELTGPHGPTTLGYGNSGQMNPQIYTKQWGDVTVTVDQSGMTQAGATATLTVRGVWHDYEG